MTDFHSHILPNVDDGSADVAESIALLRMEKAQGIEKVVATPHFYARYDSPERFLRRRAQAWQRLREACREEPELPEVILGAEVYFFSGISESELLSELTIGQKKCILIEMPHTPWTDAMYRELEGIHTKQGLTPIIAHVDRYIAPLRTQGIPERLGKLPVLVQANASFFTTRATAHLALRMLRRDQIHLLGSDCHNLTSRRPDLADALRVVEKKLGADALARIRGWEDFALALPVEAV